MGAEPRRGRLAGGVALAAAFALSLTPAEAAAPKAPVATGDYEAAPMVEEGGNYSTGLFSVEREGRKRTVVATEGYDAIFYPDLGKCDDLPLPLLAAEIPIKPTGRFRIREATPVEDGKVEVDWKARWTKAKKVSGEITIKYDGCSSTVDWTGRKVG